MQKSLDFGKPPKIDFRGTALMPEARGEAKVERKQGYIEIEVEFDDLQSATRFGPEFLDLYEARNVVRINDRLGQNMTTFESVRQFRLPTALYE
jgi:hypothetical protein